MEDPVEQYSEKLGQVVGVESVNTILPAGPDLFNLAQGKIHFYSTTAINHRLNRSDLQYLNQYGEVKDVTLIMGDLDPDVYTESKAKSQVESLVEDVGIPSERKNGFGIVTQDNSNSIFGEVVRSVGASGPLQRRASGMAVTVVSSGTWDADGFIDFVRELQDRYVEAFYKQ